MMRTKLLKILLIELHSYVTMVMASSANKTGPEMLHPWSLRVSYSTAKDLRLLEVLTSRTNLARTRKLAQSLQLNPLTWVVSLLS